MRTHRPPGLLLCLLLAATGCAPRAFEEATFEEAGIRTPLTALESLRDGVAEKPETLEVSVGPDELRDPERAGAWSFATLARLPAPKALGIVQPVGATLSFRVPALGRAPVLSTVAVRNESFPCPVDHVVHVRAAGRGPVGVALASVGMGEARSLEIDLSRWEGRAVTIDLLAVPRPGTEVCARAVWVDPTLWWRAPARSRWDPRRPNVILVSVDTLRADALGPWRRPGASITPSLDAWAAKSDVYRTAYTASNATNPSFSSILTGLYPRHHGVHDNTTTLPAERTTLADVLGAAGWGTWGVVSAHHLQVRLRADFERFDGCTDPRIAGGAVATAIDWIQSGGEPFFLWLHLFDPHTPHAPPDPYASGYGAAGPAGMDLLRPRPFREPGRPPFREPRLAAAAGLYGSEVALVDRELGRFFAFLDSRGLPARSVVVFVSDHGENLEDHGVLYRHAGLWETTTRVPLMIRWPGQQTGRTIETAVQTIDLFPTLLRGVGLEPPPSDGLDLRHASDPGAEPRPILAEHASRLGAMIRIGHHKYLRHEASHVLPAGVFLYDLAADPHELRNLAGSGHPAESELSTALDALLDSREPPPSGPGDSPGQSDV